MINVFATFAAMRQARVCAIGEVVRGTIGSPGPVTRNATAWPRWAAASTCSTAPGSAGCGPSHAARSVPNDRGTHLRRDGVKRIEVETCGTEERRPRRRGRCRGFGVAARRHRLERDQPAGVVQLHLRHAGDVHGRIGCAGRPVRRGRHEGLRAGAVPEEHDRSRAPVERVPPVGRVARPRDVRDDVEVDGQASERIDPVRADTRATT